MTENLLFLDFETTSQTDLIAAGLGRYLADPSTRAYCFTFRLPGMACADLWEAGQPVPLSVVRHVEQGGLFVAHNAPFDFWIWNRVLRRDLPQLPSLRIEQTRCTAARARYNGLPGSLAGACAALGLPLQKDLEGSVVMRQIAANPEWIPRDHPNEFARVYKYALIDTDAMVGLWNATQPLPVTEQANFALDMRINARGFGVDVEAAQAMEEMKLLAGAQLDYQITVLTQGGVLAVAEVAKIKEYAATFGEEIDDAGRESLKKIMERPDLTTDLRELLGLRLDASRAPKKSAAILRAQVDGRMHHGTVYYGALSGRSTARGAGGAQLLNVARPRPGRTAEDCEAYLEAAKRRDVVFLNAPHVGPILAALADAQRPLFCATRPGYTLVGADLSQIEARLAPWLAGDERSLIAYEKGSDLYKITAAAMFDIEYSEVSKEQRQIAKVARLAMVYGGGAGAFASMAANYGVVLPPEQVDEIVWTFRASEPELERWWSVLEYAVLVALDQPGRSISVPIGRNLCSQVEFVRDDRALRMNLPSGRAISYHNARLELEPGAQAPNAIYDKPEGYVERLDRKILANNMTQGLARDLFWAAMRDIDPIEDIVHHVYDEVLLEVPVERAELRLAQLLARLRIAPSWAPGLPLDAAGYVNPRWLKD